MAKKPQYPVYLFTGFLEGGKTKMIQEILEDGDFNDGCKILLIVCEQGVEEFDPSTFWGKNVHQMVIERPEDLTHELLYDYTAHHTTDRIMIEYNGMWQLDTLYAALPEDWYIFQQLLVVAACYALPYIGARRISPPPENLCGRYTVLQFITHIFLHNLLLYDLKRVIYILRLIYARIAPARRQLFHNFAVMRIVQHAAAGAACRNVQPVYCAFCAARAELLFKFRLFNGLFID